MKEHYVSYEQSVALKRLGFDWKVDRFYTDVIKESAREEWDEEECQWSTVYDCNYYPKPRLDQAAAWLREKGIHISVNPYMGYDVDADGALYNEYPSWGFELMKVANADFMNDAEGKHDSYESALSAGIDKALELLGKEVKE